MERLYLRISPISIHFPVREGGIDPNALLIAATCELSAERSSLDAVACLAWTHSLSRVTPLQLTVTTVGRLSQMGFLLPAAATVKRRASRRRYNCLLDRLTWKIGSQQ